MYSKHIALAFRHVFRFFIVCVASLVLATVVPELRLIFALAVSVAGMWALGNIISIILLTFRRDKAA